MNTATRPAARVIGKCYNGHVINTTPVAFVANCKVACPACGVVAIVDFMRIKLVEDKKCGTRCTSAVGPSCDCSCGGERHAMDRRGF
jgi:hypothetical protein